MPNAKRSDAEREASLAYAREHSAAEAADTFGVPLGTIRRWQWEEREKAKKAEAQAQMSDDGRVRALLTIASMERVTEKGIARLEEIIDTAKSPQSLATMCGILDDKRRLRVLEQQQAEIHDKEIEERTVRIEGQRAQDFIMVLRMAHETVGVPRGATGEIMAIVAKLFRQLGVEDVLSISPADAEKAQKAFRTWIEEDIARALRVQVADEISRPRRPVSQRRSCSKPDQRKTRRTKRWSRRSTCSSLSRSRRVPGSAPTATFTRAARSRRPSSTRMVPVVSACRGSRTSRERSTTARSRISERSLRQEATIVGADGQGVGSFQRECPARADGRAHPAQAAGLEATAEVRP